MIRSSGLFGEGYYISKNPDVSQAKINPAHHYVMFGGFEGRNPGPNFNSLWYLNNNLDVKEAVINPLINYMKFGQHED